jgi:predicted nucleotidyltransferase
MVADTALAQVASELGLRLLVLFGSRARGHAHVGSDWDLAYVAPPTFDAEELRLRVAAALGTDEIDLVDLAHGSALIRMKVASEGRPIYEASPGAFRSFAIEAARFWCDVEPVLRHAYREILDKVAVG